MILSLWLSCLLDGPSGAGFAVGWAGSGSHSKLCASAALAARSRREHALRKATVTFLLCQPRCGGKAITLPKTELSWAGTGACWGGVVAEARGGPNLPRSASRSASNAARRCRRMQFASSSSNRTAPPVAGVAAGSMMNKTGARQRPARSERSFTASRTDDLLTEASSFAILLKDVAAYRDLTHKSPLPN